MAASGSSQKTFTLPRNTPGVEPIIISNRPSASVPAMLVDLVVRSSGSNRRKTCGMGLPLYVRVPLILQIFESEPQPVHTGTRTNAAATAKARRYMTHYSGVGRGRRLSGGGGPPPPGLLERNDLAPVAGEGGLPDGLRDGVPHEPDAPVAQRRLNAPGVEAPHGPADLSPGVHQRGGRVGRHRPAGPDGRDSHPLRVVVHPDERVGRQPRVPGPAGAAAQLPEGAGLLE